MTCIVGMVNKIDNNVIIGGDSASSAGTFKSIRKDEKVFKNGEFVFGCSGSWRMIQLLRYSFSPPKINDMDVFEYMCTDFINEVRECLKNGGYASINNNVETGPYFIVGYRNRLFMVDNDFQIAEHIDGIQAIGSGDDFAYGTMYALKNFNIKPQQKIIEALKCATYYANGVEPPYVILTT